MNVAQTKRSVAKRQILSIAFDAFQSIQMSSLRPHTSDYKLTLSDVKKYDRFGILFEQNLRLGPTPPANIYYAFINKVDILDTSTDEHSLNDTVESMSDAVLILETTPPFV
jgi:hypothetical protein